MVLAEVPHGLVESLVDGEWAREGSPIEILLALEILGSGGPGCTRRAREGGDGVWRHGCEPHGQCEREGNQPSLVALGKRNRHHGVV